MPASPPRPTPVVLDAGATAPVDRPADRPAGPVTVRPAVPADCAPAAALHRQQLHSGLFTDLGPRFLRRWHGTFLDSAHGVALTAVRREGDEEVLVGFLVGATDQRRHTTHVLRRHRVHLGVPGVLGLLARPRVLRSFLRTRAGAYARRILAVTRGRAQPGAETGGPVRRTGVVTAVAVDPRARQDGVGRALLAAFLEQCRTRGSDRAELVAMADVPALSRFYTSCGWTLVGSHTTRDGEVVARYRVELAGPAATGPTTVARR